MPLPPLPVVPFSEERATTMSLAIRFFSDSVAYSITDGTGYTQLAGQHKFPLQLWEERGVDFFSNILDQSPFLVFPYKSIQITYSPAAYALIPPGMTAEDGNDEAWLLPWALMLDGSAYVDTYAIETGQPSMAVAWQRELYLFLKRTYPAASIEPITLYAIREALRRSRRERIRVLNLLLDGKTLELLAVKEGQINITNRFAVGVAPQEKESYATAVLYFVAAYLRSAQELPLANGQDVITLYYLPHQWGFDNDPLPQLKQDLEHMGYDLSATPILGLFLKGSCE